MYVKREIKGDTYRKLVEYAFKNCDTVSFTEYPDQNSKFSRRILKKLMKCENLTKDALIKNYSDKYVGYIFNKYKDSNIIFDKKYLRNRETTDYDTYELFKESKEYQKNLKKEYSDFGINISLENMSYEEYVEFFEYERRLTYLLYSIDYCVYEYYVNKFLEKYNDIILRKKKIYFYEFFGLKRTHIRTIYFMKFNNEIKRELLNKNSIFDWVSPLSIENVGFYKGDKCWLSSISHEEQCYIYYMNEKEHNYLKSIGIKFKNE